MVLRVLLVFVLLVVLLIVFVLFVVFHLSHLTLPLFLPRGRLIYIHSNLMVKNPLVSSDGLQYNYFMGILETRRGIL